MQKILEQNGIETENIDGAGFNNFTAGNRDGIIKGILNECTLYQPSSNSIAINTGEIIIKGFRIKIVDTEVKTFSSLPAVPEKWHIVARVELYSDSTLIGGLLFRNETTLIQDDLLKNEQGIYEAEVGEFVLSNSGVSDIVRTMKVIVGGTNASGESGKIEANPPQEPTEELKKLSVGDTTYSVVSTAELNKKVNTQYPSGQSVYTGTADGTIQMMLIGTNNPSPSTIVRRTGANPDDANDKGGQVFTETANKPKHAVPLEQMEEALDGKLDKVSTTFPSVDRAYIIKPDGTQSTKQVTKWYPTPDAIMLRDEKGYAKAFTPLNETPNIYHLINYEYFTAKAMPKMYRHIIRMSTTSGNTFIFSLDSTNHDELTDERDLQAELMKYGVQGDGSNDVPIDVFKIGALCVFKYSGGDICLAAFSYFNDTYHIDVAGWTIGYVSGGDNYEVVDTIIDEVYEI